MRLPSGWLIWRRGGQKQKRPTAGSRSISRSVLDSGIFPAALAILLIGLVMVASVSMPLAEKNFGNPLHYLIRQSQFAGLGLLAGLVVLQIKLSFWEKFSPLLLLGSTLLLIFVLFYGVEVKGASRWISFGAIKMQPSELAKISAFIYLSSYLVRHRKRVCIEFAAVIMPIGLLAIVSVLILLEPDLGAAVVLMVVVLIMMILAGVRTSQIVLFIALGLIAFYIAIKMEDYRWKRIVAYWNNDPLINIQIKENWQIGQSLLSFNNGGFSGVGLGEGLQKLFYLPDAHTDFILASIAEELGLIGTLSLLALFSFIVWKAFKLAQQAAAANLYFASYLAYGLGSWIGIQVLINYGVNMNILPTKGLTLPLISYGGSSLIVMMVAITLLMRIEYEVGPYLRGIKSGRKKKNGIVKGGIK